MSSLGLRSGESIIVQHVEPAGTQGLVLRRTGGLVEKGGTEVVDGAWDEYGEYWPLNNQKKMRG